jgi:hypothetical protein
MTRYCWFRTDHYRTTPTIAADGSRQLEWASKAVDHRFAYFSITAFLCVLWVKSTRISAGLDASRRVLLVLY